MKRPLWLATLAIFAATAASAQAPKPAAANKPLKQADAKPKYKRDLPAALVKEAKVTEAKAAEEAMKAVPAGKISSVELEKEDGRFIYSYDFKTTGKAGVDEVHVDAMTGAVVSNVHETPAAEKAEAKKEKAEKAAPRKADARKPPPADQR